MGLLKKKKKETIQENNKKMWTIWIMNQNPKLPKNVFTFPVEFDGVMYIETTIQDGHTIILNLYDELNMVTSIARAKFLDRLILGRRLEIVEPKFLRDDKKGRYKGDLDEKKEKLRWKKIKPKVSEKKELYYELDGVKYDKKIDFVCNLVTISQDAVRDSDKRVEYIVKTQRKTIYDLEKEITRIELRMYEEQDEIRKPLKNTVVILKKKIKELISIIDKYDMMDLNPIIEEFIDTVNDLEPYNENIQQDSISEAK